MLPKQRNKRFRRSDDNHGRRDEGFSDDNDDDENPGPGDDGEPAALPQNASERSENRVSSYLIHDETGQELDGSDSADGGSDVESGGGSGSETDKATKGSGKSDTPRSDSHPPSSHTGSDRPPGSKHPSARSGSHRSEEDPDYDDDFWSAPGSDRDWRHNEGYWWVKPSD